jgi:hypothetical protein
MLAETRAIISPTSKRDAGQIRGPTAFSAVSSRKPSPEGRSR